MAQKNAINGLKAAEILRLSLPELESWCRSGLLKEGQDWVQHKLGRMYNKRRIKEISSLSAKELIDGRSGFN